MFPPNSAVGMVASPQMVLEKQQQLVKQQQGAFVLGGSGGNKSTSFVIGGKSGTGLVSAVATTNATPTATSLVGKASQLLASAGKTSFVNIKVGGTPQAVPHPPATASTSTSSSTSPNKKERGKGSKHKDGTTGDE